MVNYFLSREKGNQGHLERYSKECGRENLGNSETRYRCNYSLLERLLCRTEANCTLIKEIKQSLKFLKEQSQTFASLPR